MTTHTHAAPTSAIRQDLAPILKHHPLLGVSEEIGRFLGAGLYPSSEKTKSRLKGQLVFQVRGIEVDEATGELKPIILSHVGRSLFDTPPGAPDKWSYFENFRKEEVIYNADHLLTHECSMQQAAESGFVVIVETPLDVARFLEAGIFNVVASFSPSLSEHQLEPLEQIKEMTGTENVLVIYNRKNIDGQEQAVNLLRQNGFQAESFFWEAKFLERSERGLVGISPEIQKVSDFNPDQISFIMEKAIQAQKKSLAPSIER